MIENANPEQFESWNGQSGHRWVANADLRDRVLAPVAELLLAAAEPRTGMDVLDIGCGCGVTTLATAAIVGHSGHVTGVDLSEVMLTVARERADGAGVENVTFSHSDAQTHLFEAGRFDLVISRFGTMFFADPVRAFANIAASMKPGAAMHLATWQPLEANEWLRAPAEALLNHSDLDELEVGDSVSPGMFAQSEPDRTASVLAEAGFGSVQVVAEQVAFNIGADAASATDYFASTGPARGALASIAEGEPTRAALADVAQVLAERETDEGVVVGGGVWIVSARRP